MNPGILKVAAYELAKYYSNADELVQLTVKCAAAAAAADAIGSAFPAVAIPATIAGCVGAVWTMYGLMCKKLGIKLGGNVLKILARAAISDIAAGIGGTLVGMAVSLFVPGVSIAVSAAVSFITVYLAGYIFMHLMLSLAKAGKTTEDIGNMKEEDLKAAIKKEKVTEEDVNEARAAFESVKKEEAARASAE